MTTPPKLSRYVTVQLAGVDQMVDRDRLATAYLLRLDHPDDPRAVRDALQAEHGYDRLEAIRMTIVAAECIRQGIEP